MYVRSAHMSVLFALSVLVIFFFFKQKTAYEMRISDWSSDVCSSDLKATLLAEAEAARIPLDATLAVGDGANDVPMIEAAGLGVAYHAKPKTAAAAHARIEHNDLSALLYAQGYPASEWWRED